MPPALDEGRRRITLGQNGTVRRTLDSGEAPSPGQLAHFRRGFCRLMEELNPGFSAAALGPLHRGAAPGQQRAVE